MLLRLLNYGFYFILILIFILAAGPFDKILIILAFLLSAVISYISFIFKWLSLDGMKAAIIIGTVTLGLGGWEFTLYLLVFFMTSNLIGAILEAPANPKELRLSERRTAEQVWANAFWYVLGISIWFIWEYETIAIAAITAIAVATSDTWATLIGGYSRDKTVRLITNFKKVPSGSDGGISINGTISAVLGAGLIALLTMFFPGPNAFIAAATILVAGFSGCLADSYFGARYQFQGKPLLIGGKRYHTGNNSINWMATGTGAIFSVILYNFLVYALV